MPVHHQVEEVGEGHCRSWEVEEVEAEEVRHHQVQQQEWH